MTDVMHMSEIRDVRLAQEFAQMAAQGYLDREFTMHGCAYWHEGERHYMISSQIEKIYDFCGRSNLIGRYPTPIMTLTKVSPVPLGQQEEIALDVKMQLARKLQESYPEGFFQLLDTLARSPNTNGAAEILRGLQRELQGTFSSERLGLFEGLVQLSFEAKVLSESGYLALVDWLREERANMAEDLLVKDLFERTFYGIAYEDKKGGIKYLSNACKETIWGKKISLEQEGVLTTPIFAKTYWYNYSYRLAQAQADFKRHLQQVLDSAYFQLVKSIHELPSALDQGLFQAQMQICATDFGQSSVQALQFYGRKWHFLY